MLRLLRASAFVSCLLALPTVAHAVPVPTGSILGIAIQGLAPLTTSGPGGVVDVTGTTITVPAGILTLGASITIPVTGVTAVNSLVITKLSNLSATFSIGGVTAHSPAEVCPSGGPAAGSACNTGGGLGGAMAITGTVFVHIVPNVVVIPVNLNAARIGQGGVGAGAFTTEAGLWSTGAGVVNTGNALVATTGTAQPITLVSPTYISALGNVLPILAFFSLSSLFVPESGSLLLLLTGLGGLAALGLPRRR